MKPVNVLIIGILAVTLLCVSARAEPNAAPAPEALLNEINGHLADVWEKLEQCNHINVWIRSQTAAVGHGVKLNHFEKNIPSVVEAVSNPDFEGIFESVWSLDYYRGADGFHRTELAPIYSGRVMKDENEENRLISPGRITYQTGDGKRYLSLHQYSVDPGSGDVHLRRDFREVPTNESRTTKIADLADFNPKYVYSTRGIPWDSYFGSKLSLAESAEKIILPDGSIQYIFHDKTDESEWRYQLEFGNYDGSFLPNHYLIYKDGGVVEAQSWKHLNYGSDWLPAASQLDIAAATPGVITYERVSYWYAESVPIDSEALRSKDPLREYMQQAFDLGKEWETTSAAERQGVELSGKVIESE